MAAEKPSIFACCIRNAARSRERKSPGQEDRGQRLDNDVSRPPTDRSKPCGRSSASINQLSRLLSSLSPSLGQLLQINVCVTRPFPWRGADVVNQLPRSLISIWDYVTPICFRHTLRECTLVHADGD